MPILSLQLAHWSKIDMYNKSKVNFNLCFLNGYVANTNKENL
jgi:hypothetical protein